MAVNGRPRQRDLSPLRSLGTGRIDMYLIGLGTVVFLIILLIFNK